MQAYVNKLTELGAVLIAPLQESQSPSVDSAGGLVGAWSGTTATVLGPGELGLGGAVSLTPGAILLLDSAPPSAAITAIGTPGVAYTVGGWVKTTASTSNAGSLWYWGLTLFEARDEGGSGTQCPWHLGVTPSGTLGFAAGRARTDVTRYASELPINDGEWHWIAVVVDGTSLTLLVDVDAETVAIPAADRSLRDEGDAQSNISIGCRTTDAGGTTNQASGAYAGWFVVPSALAPLALEELRQYGLSGPVSTLAGGPVTGGDITILVRDWATHEHVGVVTPDEAGYWSIDVLPGQYDVTYIADGCAPICHGPYTVEAPTS